MPASVATPRSRSESRRLSHYDGARSRVRTYSCVAGHTHTYIYTRLLFFAYTERGILKHSFQHISNYTDNFQRKFYGHDDSCIITPHNNLFYFRTKLATTLFSIPKRTVVAYIQQARARILFLTRYTVYEKFRFKLCANRE